MSDIFVLCALIIFVIFIYGAIAILKRDNEIISKTNQSILNNEIAGFSPTKSIGPQISNDRVYIDENNRKVLVINLLTQEKHIINFEDIIECSILENGATVQKGGVGRAIVGSAIAGGVGAIVGATTRGSASQINSLSVRIVTRDIKRPLVELKLIKTASKRDSSWTKTYMHFAQEVYATIVSIIDSVQNSTEQRSSKNTPCSTEHKQNHSVEILEQLADLRDKGILTEEEFTAKKQSVLGIEIQ